MNKASGDLPSDEEESDDDDDDEEYFANNQDDQSSKSSSTRVSASDCDNLLHMFNLPYTITSDHIINTALKFGVLLSEVVLNKDATGRPAGSAVATCQALVSTSTGEPFTKEEREQEKQGEEEEDLAEMCAFLLVEKTFGSRPLRVQTTVAMRVEKGRRRQENMASGSGRYFGLVSSV
jgi:hypothetical protein